MRAPSLPSPAQGLLSSVGASLRSGLDAASHLLGLSEVRADREPALLTLRLGAPGETGVAVLDRRDGQDRTYRLDLRSDDLADRIAWPYAVGTRRANESRTTFTHFKSKRAAALFAQLMTSDDVHVTRWVAVTEPEYNAQAVTPGWRQVIDFNI